MKKTYDDDFKKKVAKASLESGATLKSVGEEYGVNPTLVRNWKIKFQDEVLDSPRGIDSDALDDTNSGHATTESELMPDAYDDDEDAPKNPKYTRILESDELQDLMEGLENKIMETGLLTDLVGFSGFDVGICLKEYDNDGKIKLVIDIGHDEDDFEMTSDTLEEISDNVRDYASERFELFEFLEENGIEDAEEIVDWTPVLFNGSAIDLDDEDDE